MPKEKKIYIQSVQFSYVGTDGTFQYFLERLIENYLCQGEICNISPSETVEMVEKSTA